MLWISTESKKPTWSVVAGQVGSWGSFAGISSRTTLSLPGRGPSFLSKGKPAHCYSWKTNYTSSSCSFGNPRWERSLLEGRADLHRFPWRETLVILSGVVETVLLKTKGLGTYCGRPRFVPRVGWSQADPAQTLADPGSMLKLYDPRQGQNLSGPPFLHLKNEVGRGMVCLTHFFCPFSDLTYLKCLKDTSNIEVQ